MYHVLSLINEITFWHSQSWWPLWPQDIKTNTSITVYVWMVNFCCESNLNIKQKKLLIIHELWKQTEPICSKVKCPQFHMTLEEKCIQHKLDEHLLYPLLSSSLVCWINFSLISLGSQIWYIYFPDQHHLVYSHISVIGIYTCRRPTGRVWIPVPHYTSSVST